MTTAKSVVLLSGGMDSCVAVARFADLPAAERSALSSLCWGAKHFDGLMTGRQTTRRAVLSLCRKGLAESIGYVEQCDDDGWLIPGRRNREAFKPTKAGQRMYDAYNKPTPVRP